MTQDLDAERENYVRLLESTLQRAVEELSRHPEVQRVSLFGSYASGRRADLSTDLDLLVVMETTDGPIDRLRRLYSLIGSPVDIDIICYTPEEFERLKDSGLLHHVLEHERLLYDKSKIV